MKTIISILLIGLIIFSGCVSSSGEPQWDNYSGTVREYCEAINASYVYGGIYHEGCTINGQLIELVCPTPEIKDCAIIEKKVVP